jgi:hypothetical protein
MKGLGALGALLVALAVVEVARGGHEFPVYPSYYPHEIRVQTIPVERAADQLLPGKIQAYIGPELHFTNAPPDAIRAIESLGSFVVVRVNPGSPLAKDDASACAVARSVVRDLAGRTTQLIFHPYPITPFHGDFLYHADLAEAAKTRLLTDSAGASPATRSLKVRAAGALAKSLVRPAWYTNDANWDAAIEEISAADLVASSAVAMNGWLGPRPVRAGWFQAALVLSRSVDDPRTQERVRADLHRLETGAFESTVERINLEREVVGALATSCHAVVTGYTVKREYVSTEYNAGIENIGFDSIEGLQSPMFIRTAKLKDFPWNGWLTLGTDVPPAAAWNPIGGFTDRFGRLMWFALSDPALLPAPNDEGWMLNRISDVQSSPIR